MTWETLENVLKLGIWYLYAMLFKLIGNWYQLKIHCTYYLEIEISDSTNPNWNV